MKEKSEVSQKKNNIFFSDHLDDIFIKNLKKFPKPELGPLQVSNIFFLKTSSSSDKMKKFQLDLHGKIIMLKYPDSNEQIGYMEVENTFLRKVQVTFKERQFYSLKFIKPKSFEEIFQMDEQVVDKWFQLLKRHCVLIKFNHYFETISIIGRGSFAMVYSVRKIDTNEEFAVKVFNKKYLNENLNEKKSVLNEIKIMRNIDHPRLLKFIELYEGENHIYLVMQLCKGDNLLNHLIKNGFQPEKKALNLLLQLLEGIIYMHSNKIMHRDMKPENIIFENKNNLKLQIVDLGFATYFHEYQSLFTRCGTPGYIAPEILKNKTYDQKVDIFSLGVIFYIILTARMPFSGKDCNEIIKKNRTGKVNYNFDHLGIQVSEETQDLLKKMLAADPNERISAHEALGHVCFEKMLSFSPLVQRTFFNAQELIEIEEITKNEQAKQLENNPILMNFLNKEKAENLSPIKKKE